MRKPVAQHNAEIAAHMARWFPADPGKAPRLFTWMPERNCWIGTRRPIAARPGFLNYEDKIEILKNSDGSMTVLKRRDMTDAEFSALPIQE